MKVQAIIPARLSSTRLENKVLEDISGKPMIIHIYETLKGCNLLSDVCIATEDKEIYEVSKSYNAKCMMTDACSSGTERVIKCYEKLGRSDLLVNVQGDEPLISCDHIKAIIKIFTDHKDAQIGTLIETFETEEDLRDPNNVKVVLSDYGKAIYFSRSVIPFAESLKPFHYKHVGLYAFKHEVVTKLSSIPRSSLSIQERLEQLDWLVAEYPIYTALINDHLVGVDTASDLEKVRKILANR